MATTWTTESNTQAISTVSTIDTTLTLDDRKSFIIKNKAGVNRFQVENATGNATIAGDANISANCTIAGTLGVTGNTTLSGILDLQGNSITSPGDLTITPGGGDIIVAGDLKLNTGQLKSSDNSVFMRASGLNVQMGGDCEVVGNIETENDLTVSEISSFGGLSTFTSGIKLGNNIIYASDGGTAITLDTSDNVTITGDLTVSGNTITSNKLASSTVTIDASNDISLEAQGVSTGIGSIFFKGRASDTLIMTARITGSTPQVLIEDTLLVGGDFYIDGTKVIDLEPGGDIVLQNLTRYDGNFTVDGSITVNETVNIVGTSAGGLSILWANYKDGTSDRMRFNVRSFTHQDVEIALYEGAGVKWVLGNDATGGSSDDLFCIGTTAAFAANKFELDTSGNLKLLGKFGCNGVTPPAAPDYSPSSYSVNRTITGSTSAADTTDVLATLIADLIATGILAE